jgi:hypothetical protein
MGRRGEPLVRITDVQVVSVRREPLERIDVADGAREGFPGMSPEEFVRRFFVEAQGIQPDAVVTRIEWVYVDEPAEQLPAAPGLDHRDEGELTVPNPTDDTRDWSGPGWAVRRDAGQPEAITVSVDHALSPGREPAAGHRAAPRRLDCRRAAIGIRLDARPADRPAGPGPAAASPSTSTSWRPTRWAAPTGRHHGYVAELTDDGVRVSVVAGGGQPGQ